MNVLQDHRWFTGKDRQEGRMHGAGAGEKVDLVGTQGGSLQTASLSQRVRKCSYI